MTNMLDLSALSSLGDLAKQMQDAYADGTSVMDQAAEEVAKEIDPDHLIEINIKLQAKIEGHNYEVETKTTFEIELDPVLNTEMGDLSSLLDGLDVDLGDDKAAVMEQLGQARAIGVVKEIDTKKLEVSNKDGKVEAKLNKKASLLATIKEDKILINFESLFSYPKQTDLYIAIPSMEAMQKNIVVNKNDLYKKIEFSWTEKNKDNLKVSGDLKIKKV